MRFKFLAILLVFIAAIGGGIYALNQQMTNVSVNGIETKSNCQMVADINWCQYEQENAVKALNIAIFTKPIQVYFTATDATSLQSQGALENLSLATNGTYYMDTPLNATHSGLLQIKGEVISKLALDPAKQVTRVVVFNEENNEVSIESAKDFPVEDYEGEEYTLFQTGPLLIENGEIMSSEIQASANGNTKAMRTLLGIMDNGERFLAVTRLEFTLEDLAKNLLELDIFQGKNITVVNLDGGSSTAMYSRDLDNFNWRKTTRLPSVIGVK